MTQRSAAGARRRPFGWIRRVLLGVTSAVLLTAVAPAVASAAITVTNATLTSAGVKSLAAPPGSVAYDSKVTVTVTAGDTTRAIAYSYNSNLSNSTCVDVSGRSPYTVDIVLPRTPSDPSAYSLYFQASTASGCGGTKSNVFTLPAAVRVTASYANPGLAAGCGLNVMLVLDESYSIATTSGATAKVREAAKSFLGALSGTGSHVAIIAFSRTAALNVGYTLVNGSTINDVFTPYIDNTRPGGYNPNRPAETAATNWEAAFEKVREANESAASGLPGARHADLVVYITDGDPNTFNNASGGTTTGKDGSIDSMVPAAAAAGRVKLQGSHVFVIGVGAAVNNASSESRLTAISGPNAYPGDKPFGSADYTVVANFDGLAQSLREIAVQLCESSLIVTKLVAAADGEGYAVAPGWRFTTTLTVPGGHEWLVPAAGSTSSASASTGDDGVARFEWRTNSADAHATVDVAETQMAGYQFVQAQCQTVTLDGPKPIETDTTGIPSATLLPHEYRTCEVYNAVPRAHLTVVKQLIPSTDVGRFDLLVDGVPRIEQVGDGGSTGQLTLALGTHTVSEQVTAAEAGATTPVTLDQYAISTSCVNQTTGAAVASGTGSAPVSVTLASSSDNVVCTITNQRIVEPEPPITPPGPPVTPPPPCGDFNSAVAECGDDDTTILPQASLEVVKRMPAQAHVGDLVPITITVKNDGAATATNVLVRDNPPGGGRVVRAAGLKTSRRKDGAVAWALGDLAPGQQRTIHATMLITAASPIGAVRNTAFASAGNADVVIAKANVRVLRLPAPAVTG
jgi:uncharacterized repeat protein (TIGR01451 family)